MDNNKEKILWLKRQGYLHQQLSVLSRNEIGIISHQFTDNLRRRHIECDFVSEQQSQTSLHERNNILNFTESLCNRQIISDNGSGDEFIEDLHEITSESHKTNFSRDKLISEC